ncbi:MAG: bifunctional adenosylcobinamide kinase/adenosylcobinamide-phosphate guanylyltransferase [Bacilli bacterium]|nr:bifunctional adenosylcobinamide kinase/adenosylcobinamide-phosphate guanylyltransferase [Bacilli bacterium]
MLVLVTGGARSGKSKFAERYTAHLGTEAIYVATAQIYDEEMQRRMEQHQAQRDQSDFAWQTMVEPYELMLLLKKLDKEGSAPIVLVDCLTLWLSNWLLKWQDDPALEIQKDRILQLADELFAGWVSALSCFSGTVLMVTNEVGDGIVPEYPLGRLYRDLAGIMNQKIALICDQVFLVTAGIPLELKSNAFRF